LNMHGVKSESQLLPWDLLLDQKCSLTLWIPTGLVVPNAYGKWVTWHKMMTSVIEEGRGEGNVVKRIGANAGWGHSVVDGTPMQWRLWRASGGPVKRMQQ
jgi:hypothetical protein